MNKNLFRIISLFKFSKRFRSFEKKGIISHTFHQIGFTLIGYALSSSPLMYYEVFLQSSYRLFFLYVRNYILVNVVQDN